MKYQHLIYTVLFLAFTSVSCEKDGDESVCRTGDTFSSCQDCCDTNGYDNAEYNGLAPSGERCTCLD